MKISKNIAIIAGPVIFGVVGLALENSFGFKAAFAIAATAWLALWWVLRPVSIAVTSLLPIVINALFNLIPNEHVISQYFSPIVVLLLGADLICLTWMTTGLDKRISVKALCYIGTSMKQQIAVWLGASVVLSAFLPNVVVAAIFCPIAVAMLKFVGETDINNSRLSIPILLAISWGSGIGGLGSPIGSSANLVAISYLENMTGSEFMYVDWVLRFAPILFLIFLLNLFFIWRIKIPVQELNGTRAFFKTMYADFGPMRRGEKIGLILFIIALIMAFLRPLYADILPSLKPAYSFLLIGLLLFFLNDENNKPMLTWKYAESHAMWGMMFLFASGMAIGRMIIETGAVAKLAAIIVDLQVTNELLLMIVFCSCACLMTEISSNTAAVSISIPVVTSICQSLTLNPVPYILATIIASSCAYVLPLSTRAIPVGFGLNAGAQIEEGIKLTLLCLVMVIILCYIFMKYLPFFSLL